MDTTEPIIFNGHTSAPIVPQGATPVGGCRIKQIDPSEVSVAASMTKRAVTDGVTTSDVYLGGRTFTIYGEVFGTTPGDMWDRVEAWMRAYSPRSPDLLDTAPWSFYQPTADLSTWPQSAYPKGIPLYMTCKPWTQPRHGTVIPAMDAAGPQQIDVFAQLLAADPYKYINEARINTTLTSASQALSYRGNAPFAKPDLWIKVGATGPSSVTVRIASALNRQDIGYTSLALDLSGLTPGSTYVLSFDDHSCKTGSTTKAGVIQSSSIFGAITPGATAWYTVNVGTPGNITFIKLLYNEAMF